MIKIESTANNTITVTDSESHTTTVTLGTDCSLRVYDEVHMYAANIKKRTLIIFNKYNMHMIASVNGDTLDSNSSSYNANMDTYAAALRDSVLYS